MKTGYLKAVVVMAGAVIVASVHSMNCYASCLDTTGMFAPCDAAKPAYTICKKATYTDIDNNNCDYSPTKVACFKKADQICLESFMQSAMLVSSGPNACDGSNASDVCALDSNTINSVVCIRNEVVNGTTKLKYFANKATCVGGNIQYLKRYWCQDGHTVKESTITCDAGDGCYGGQCHHYDAQTKTETAYPYGTNAVGYTELYGSTDAVSCSKQDNALQNICKTVDNNKGIETQFPSAWSRLKYYGGCK